ncbi:MAG: DUF4906 domain-containing protein [Rikenellaceae bacterium]
MKTILKNHFWALLLVTAMAVGCAKDSVDEGGIADLDGDAIALSLNLSAGSMEAGTEETKSSATRADDSDLSAIKNLWVIQINGVDVDADGVIDDESLVVGQPTYIENYDSDSDKSAYLIPTDSDDALIIFLANTYVSDLAIYSGATTLGGIKKLSKTIASESECTANNTIILSGTQRGAITKDTNLNAELRHNIAKVDVNIENNCSTLTISKIQFSGVADEIIYYTHQDDVIEAPFPDDVNTFRYEVQELVFSDNKASISAYLPANLQGTSASIDETTKASYAPYAATLCAIYAYDTASEMDIIYKMYLGADMIKDYNLEPNKYYTYNFTFNSVGQIGYDSRIETLEPIVDYRSRESSNCYILNPSVVNQREYYIPIQDRIYTFWTEYASNQTTLISNSWEIVPLWYDCDENPFVASDDDLVDGKILLEKSLDEGYPESVKVTLSSNFTNYGNVAFAVKQEGKILWSWHLWITDYNPDSTTHIASNTESRYSVSNGAIHRYSGDLWTSGGYSDKFMMDRNVGARSTEFASSAGAGTLYYQYGRKDPFLGYAGYYVDENNPKTVTGNSNTSFVNTPAGIGKSFEYAVTNPTTYFTSDTRTPFNWCSETDAYITSYYWNDKNATDYTADGVKSIFDPSPLGWRVPISGTWYGFSTSTFPCNDDNNARIYNDFAVYPAAGYRAGESSGYGIGSNGSGGYFWTAQTTGLEGIFLHFWISQNSVTINRTDLSPAWGFSVRSVRDN